MNVYLMCIGSNLSKIREILGWSQQELCNKVGISRPVISNIEKSPDKTTKMFALALYTVSFNEIECRKEFLNNLDYNAWINNTDHLLNDLNTNLNINKNYLNTAITTSSLSLGIAGAALAPALMLTPMLGFAATLGGTFAAAHALSKNKKHRETDYNDNPFLYVLKNLYSLMAKEKNTLSSNISKDDLKNALLKIVESQERGLLECFGLESKSVNTFISNIENHENNQ